jgi:hypothetical protein
MARAVGAISATALLWKRASITEPPPTHPTAYLGPTTSATDTGQAAQSWIGTRPNQLAARQSMAKLNSDIHADMRAFQLDDGRQQHSLALVVAQLPH